MPAELRVIGIGGIGDVVAGDDVGALLAAACTQQDTGVQPGDVVVVAQKIVSKAEGRIVDAATREDIREVVRREARRIVRETPEHLIVETSHGFICANAGVDLSNIEDGWAALLPDDPDRSARRIRDGIRARAGVEVAVIVSDTFGRPWRRGLTDVAIGCAGIGAIADLRGTSDAVGRELQVTEVAVVDELAGAADLVMGKASGAAAAVVRGVDPAWFRQGEVRAELIRRPDEDLFR
jgi:coenzyme F420-0:L-glutamate ligase/coenzyme F420-1:gamma-L-glutamate ligase